MVDFLDLRMYITTTYSHADKHINTTNSLVILCISFIYMIKCIDLAKYVVTLTSGGSLGYRGLNNVLRSFNSNLHFM